MANKKDYRDLSQVDYCIRQYFSKYMASTIEQEMEKLENGQTMDCMMSRCKKRWDKDSKLRRDTLTFADAFYKCLLARNGGQPSEQLRADAIAYVSNRYESLTIEQLARKKVPSNSAEYIAKKAFSESFIGFGAFLASKKDDIGDKIKEKAEELYNPSGLEVATGFAGGIAIDSALTGGAGIGITAARKGAAVAAAKTMTKLSAKSVGKHMAVNTPIAGGIHYLEKQSAGLDDKQFGNIVFGDEDALKKIQDGGLLYKKGGTEYINAINGHLCKKIKTPQLSTSSIIKKESNALLVKHKGNSGKLLNAIKTMFAQQAIPYNGNNKVPGWMLDNSAKQNRALSASFYACALEMSKNQQSSRKFGGKTMTLKEVAQRAYDYARAATIVEQRRTSVIKTPVNKQKSSPKSVATPYRSSTDISSSPYAQAYQASQSIQSSQTTSPATSANLAQNSGWGNALELLGSNGFSDISKNLGYVLAMLPDMIIGMFTGKTPNLKLQDNLMPLAAIMGGMFVKNPLLKMLLMGFGGANILNKAGHAAIDEGLSKSNNRGVTTYKSYGNETLNPRIQNPAMKGCSMIATIDGVPSVINISEDAADAYAKGAIPINTLANAVLRKYDENHALASQKYEQHVNQEEESRQHLGIK